MLAAYRASGPCPILVTAPALSRAISAMCTAPSPTSVPACSLSDAHFDVLFAYGLAPLFWTASIVRSDETAPLSAASGRQDTCAWPPVDGPASVQAALQSQQAGDACHGNMQVMSGGTYHPCMLLRGPAVV